ncbi:MAG: TonB-dependent receptor, partial [Bacteroidales bacterium]|nr:TonB-dependent receptor [Bacteroidales bacterium]
LTELDEVVVIGYGTQKKKVVTGAIASISSEEITSAPILRVEQALQGRTAGVQVTNLSGQPGEAPTVRIRGSGTTGNAEPLYVVDGMAVGGIDYLNPGDIVSIDVLKDAASAAIYGARAANGVVLITTRSGQSGELSVSYNGYYGVQNPWKKLDRLNSEDYRMIMNEGARNASLTEPFDLNEIPTYNTNWQDVLFEQNAPISEHQLSVSGGNDKSTFASSVSAFEQQGIIGGEKSQFERLTARINSVHKVNSKFTFGNNLAYTHIIRRGIGSNQSFNGAYSSALNLDPLTPVYETDPTILDQAPYSNQPVIVKDNGDVYGISEYIGAEIVNPLALISNENAGTRVDKLVGNFYGVLELVEGLKFRSNYGIDLAYVLSDSFRPLFYLNGAQLNTEKTSVSKAIDRYSTWQWENTLSYEKEIGDHNIGALVGITANETNYENLSGWNANVPVNDPNNVYLNMAIDTVDQAGGGAYSSALYSQFARVTYDYKDKYLFTAIVRRDGSSKFGANNRFGIFPSVGLGWVISDEIFLSDVESVSYLKLRASWGVNGNQEIGNYRFVSTINNSVRGYTFGGGYAFGASPSYIENADVHWEESVQLDIGTDFGFFNNRLTGVFDYYVKTTKGLLETIPIPAHIGNSPPVANVGSVENRGVELGLNWRDRGGLINYSVGFNVSKNKNTVTHIGNDDKVLPGATWATSGFVTRIEEGLPIGYFWGYITDGIFQDQDDVFRHINKQGEVLQPDAVPGDVRFVDDNKDGVINEDDRTMIGNPTPSWILGLNASLEYRGFDFSVLINSALGQDIFNGMQRRDLRYTNRSSDILDRWTGPGTSDTQPRFTWIDINKNSRISDLYIEDGSYVRIKNIQLGYNIPSSVLQKIGAENLRIYISAENLFTLTSYSGADPEIGAMSSTDIGIDRGIYPQARTFRFGTSIKF